MQLAITTHMYTLLYIIQGHIHFVGYYVLCKGALQFQNAGPPFPCVSKICISLASNMPESVKLCYLLGSMLTILSINCLLSKLCNNFSAYCSAWSRLKLNTKIGLNHHHHRPPPTITHHHKLLEQF